MRKLIIIILVSLLSGCGIFKRTSKVKEVEQVETSTTVKSDQLDTSIDKTVTVVKETVDTTVVIPGKVLSAQVNIDSLLKGVIAIKDNLVNVKLDYDPITKLLTTTATILPQVIPIKKYKETTINADVTKASKRSEVVATSEKKKTKKVDKKKEPAKMGIWFLAFLTVVGAAIYILKRLRR